MQLRPDQTEILNRIRNSANRIIFKAPTEYGKTTLAIQHAVDLLHSKKVKRITYSIPNYEMRDYVGEKFLELDNKLVVVCPEGKNERTFLTGSRKKKFHIPQDFKSKYAGKIIDTELIKREFPKVNPYRALLRLSEYADVVIAHHELLDSNPKLWNGGMLIVDDPDTKFRKKQFLIFKRQLHFSETGRHMSEIPEDTIFENVKNKLDPDKTPFIFRIFEFLDIPDTQTLEADSVVRSELILEPIRKIMQKAEEDAINRGETPEEKIQIALRIKMRKISFAISGAGDELKIQELYNELAQLIKANVIDKFPEEVERERNYITKALLNIVPEIDTFLGAVIYPEFTVKLSSTDKPEFRYLEVYVNSKSNFLETIKKFDPVLILSATVDPSQFEGFSVVETRYDPNSDHKAVVEIEKDKIIEVLKKYRNNNVFFIANSKNRALQVQSELKEQGFDSTIMNKDNFDGVLTQAKTNKGFIAIGYVEMAGSRGYNGIENCFDVVLVDSWIQKSTNSIDGKFYGEEQIRENMNAVYQLISRVARGSNNHAVYITKSEDSCFDLTEYLKDTVPDWKFDNIPENFIPERQETAKIPIRLHKTVRTLKNGEKELIYTAKADNEQINNAPEFIDL